MSTISGNGLGDRKKKNNIVPSTAHVVHTTTKQVIL